MNCRGEEEWTFHWKESGEEGGQEVIFYDLSFQYSTPDETYRFFFHSTHFSPQLSTGKSHRFVSAFYTTNTLSKADLSPGFSECKTCSFKICM